MTESNAAQQYTVVARRYRPQNFTDLVGQGHISTALGNAIKQNRVGHAYLFTGARGVGKTSSARIFAKCLNCKKGPAQEPCNECDICEAVSIGEDVDVLEIDGASNRGIDEIRQLRSNAGVRPSRARFKIYIIDEVHMLTQQAFNALLKTLEEPPEHVKFIFCTTDPQKIPITVLSRCQRFDFSPVQTDEITKRLQEIAETEGVRADEQALNLLARRAGGSMRDSQSLLEQLFSFCGNDITVDEVHKLLGTADISRIARLAETMSEHDSASSLNLLAEAVADGVDAGQLAKQLLGYFRDMMACRVGCGLETLLMCNEADLATLTKLANGFGLETILTITQVLDSTVVRMQSSMHTRTLLEIAIVRICNLHQLDALPDLVAALTSGSPVNRGGPKSNVATPAKKNERIDRPAPEVTQPKAVQHASESNHPQPAAASSSPSSTQRAQHRELASESAPSMVGNGGSVIDQTIATAETAVATLAPETTAIANAKDIVTPTGAAALSTPESQSSDRVPETKPASGSGSTLSKANAKSLWEKALKGLSDMTAEIASTYEDLRVDGPGRVTVILPDAYNRDLCSKPERQQKLEAAFATVVGARIALNFEASANPRKSVEASKPRLTRAQQVLLLREVPIVKTVMEIFSADIVDFHAPKPKK